MPITTVSDRVTRIDGRIPVMLRTILGHPIIKPLKRLAKDAWWRHKGRSIFNPPMPSGARSVLFVCLGNICRSPFAEAIATRRVQGGSGSIRFNSAGLKTKQAAEPPLDARRAAATFGVSLNRHRPRSLTRELVVSHDVIVVMEPGHRDHICATYPEAADRVLLLALFDENATGLERYIIADPFGMAASVYQECYQRIERALNVLLPAIGVEPTLESPRRRAC